MGTKACRSLRMSQGRERECEGSEGDGERRVNGCGAERTPAKVLEPNVHGEYDSAEHPSSQPRSPAAERGERDANK